jgi:methyl-accepting chemotaxis protein
MKIKTKLTFNILLVVIAVGIVVGTSIFGMTFIKSKLSYLTQKSTPYQIRTVEFQRELQGSITDLVKVNAARTMAEYKTFRAEAEKSLASVKSAQQALEEMSSTKLGASDELSQIAQELFNAAEARITSDNAATEANAKVSQRMKESSARLKELDRRIRNLQINRSSAFATALQDTGQFSGKLRSVEELRNLVKDLQLIFITVQNAQKSTAVLIAKGKVNSVLGRIASNDYQKSNATIAADAKAVTDKLDEYIKLQSASLTQKDDDSRNKAVESGKELSEKLNGLYLALDQEATLAGEKVGIETSKQGSMYGQSNSANTILLTNSELVALGLMVEGQTNRLFTLDSTAEIDKLDPEIRTLFTRITERSQAVEKALAKLGAKEELKILKAAVASLATIRTELYANDGIVSTLKKHLIAADQAIKAGDKLRTIVLKQSEKGKETVTAARGEQEKAIGSVNRIVQTSITLLIAISVAAIVIGILFGIWVFRSVSRPLGELIRVSDSVAGGDLHIGNIQHSSDEFGQVQSSMEKMVLNLRDMAGKITDSTATIASSSEELSSTAGELDRNSQTQTCQIEQSVTAMTEMVQTIQDVSLNASNTSDAAGRMKGLAQDGQKALNDTSRELVSFAEIVRQSADKIEGLGVKSNAINDIVDMIKDIADQTNLLALNASIEAARAGEMGRGFAVVADSVRELAHRTIESSGEISRTVKDMQHEVEGSVAFMQNERKAIDKIVSHVDTTQRSMGEIVACVEQVFDMIQTIATATEEQSATAEDVNRNMTSINDITRQLTVSVGDIKGTSESFARLAAELNQMVAWFRL